MRVGTLIGDPLHCEMAKADGPIRSLADRAGKRVGFSVPGLDEALLHRILQTNGVDPSSVEEVSVTFALTKALAAGQVEAVSGAFRDVEPQKMESLGQKASCFNPEDNGAPADDEPVCRANPQAMDRDRIARF